MWIIYGKLNHRRSSVPIRFWPQNNSLDQALPSWSHASSIPGTTPILWTNHVPIFRYHPWNQGWRCRWDYLYYTCRLYVDYIYTCLYMYVCICIINIWTSSVMPFCHLCRSMAWNTGPGLRFGHIKAWYTHISGMVILHTDGSSRCIWMYPTKTLLIGKGEQWSLAASSLTYSINIKINPFKSISNTHWTNVLDFWYKHVQCTGVDPSTTTNQIRSRRRRVVLWAVGGGRWCWRSLAV